MSLAIAVVMALLQRAAGAQVNVGQIACPIIINLINAFGGFLAGILSALLSFFGCVISG